MKYQNVYESNFDYEATYEALLSTLKGVDKTQKGLISFRFKPKNVEVLLSRYGKVQVAWNSPKEKEMFFPILKGLLIPPKGQKITLKPKHMNIVNIEHPGPKKLTLAWCKERIRYFRKLGFLGFIENWQKRKAQEEERKLRELKADIYAQTKITELNEDEFTFEKVWQIEDESRKRYGLEN